MLSPQLALGWSRFVLQIVFYFSFYLVILFWMRDGWPERRSVEKGLTSMKVQVTTTAPEDLAVKVAGGGSLGVLGHTGCTGQWFPPVQH